MTAEMIAAFGTALAVVITAVGALWLKLRSLTQHLNSRLDLLLQVVEEKGFSAGAAAERERATGEPAHAKPPQETPPHRQALSD